MGPAARQGPRGSPAWGLRDPGSEDNARRGPDRGHCYWVKASSGAAPARITFPSEKMRRFKIGAGAGDLTLQTRRTFSFLKIYLLGRHTEGRGPGQGRGQGEEGTGLHAHGDLRGREPRPEVGPEPKADAQPTEPRGLTSLHLPCIFNAELPNPPITP